MAKNVGFVGTRFVTTDSVAMESAKWADVLGRHGFDCYWFAGEVDRDPAKSTVVAEAHPHHPDNRWINDQILNRKRRDLVVTERIHRVQEELKQQLRQFLAANKIDLLVIENVLSSPTHVPLALAVTEVLAENRVPTVAHHYQWYWSQPRFVVNAVSDYLQMAYPPRLPHVQHVVVNVTAQEELAHRTGIAAIQIPVVADFQRPPDANPDDAARVLEGVGLHRDALIVFQPTRVIRRKGIEYALELVRALGRPDYKLLLSYAAGEEDDDYVAWLKRYADDHGVDLRIVALGRRDVVESKPRIPLYSLQDVYRCADLITFPSFYEGTADVFLDAVYFRKPVVINRYAPYVREIETLGFNLIETDGFLTPGVVDQVMQVLGSHERRRLMVENNFRIAARHFSYAVLWKRLSYLLMNFFGMSTEQTA